MRKLLLVLAFAVPLHAQTILFHSDIEEPTGSNPCGPLSAAGIWHNINPANTVSDKRHTDASGHTGTAYSNNCSLLDPNPSTNDGNGDLSANLSSSLNDVWFTAAVIFSPTWAHNPGNQGAMHMYRLRNDDAGGAYYEFTIGQANGADNIELIAICGNATNIYCSSCPAGHTCSVDNMETSWNIVTNRGVAHIWEWHVHVNTPSNFDGLVEFYVDGSLIFSRGGLNVTGAQAGTGIPQVNAGSNVGGGSGAANFPLSTNYFFTDCLTISSARLASGSRPNGGTCPNPAGGGSVSLAPGSVAFPPTGNGSNSQSVFSLSNGTGSAISPAISITGPNAGQFSQANTCGGSLAAGASCSITVTFSPTSVASDSATLNAGGLTSAMTGAVPSSSLAPASLAFGNVTVNTTASLTTTLTNTGFAPLSVTSVSTSGAPFTQTSGCTTLAPSATCNITVVFSPTAATGYSGSLSVTFANGVPSGSVSLTGTGFTPAPPTAQIPNPFFSLKYITCPPPCDGPYIKPPVSCTCTVSMTAAYK